MTVYAEFVFLENFFIDLYLFTLTSSFLHVKTSARRLIVLSVIGGTLSAMMPLLGGYGVFLKIFCILFFPACLRKNKHVTEYCTTMCVFVAVTLLLGGLLYALKYTILGKLLSDRNASASLVGLTGLSLCCLHYILQELGKSGKLRRYSDNRYRVILRCNEDSYAAEGFFDSGNRVYAKNGEPVTILDYSIYNRLRDQEGRVRVATVTGEKTFGTKQGSVEIYFPNGEHTVYRTVFASAPDLNLQEGVLLHGDVFGG